MKTTQIRKKGISRLPCMGKDTKFYVGEAKSQWLTTDGGTHSSYNLSTGYISIHGLCLCFITIRYRYDAKSTSAANVSNFKMAFVISLKNYCFRIIIKNLTKRNILSTFALKNNGKFTNQNLEKVCLWFWPRPRPFLSLASRRSVLKKSVLGPGLGFF